MNNYNIFLLLPIFKNLKFLQNEIFNQENFISRSAETRSLGEALNSRIFYEKIVNISIPKSSLFLSSTVIDQIISNFNLDLVVFFDFTFLLPWFSKIIRDSYLNILSFLTSKIFPFSLSFSNENK